MLAKAKAFLKSLWSKFLRDCEVIQENLGKFIR